MKSITWFVVNGKLPLPTEIEYLQWISLFLFCMWAITLYLLNRRIKEIREYKKTYEAKKKLLEDLRTKK